MADWKQIQGRIRRAKASADAPGKLAELYEKTHDAMVAFELARHLEKAGDAGGAGRWYVTAGQGFRRPQWKAKAEEALIRLGIAPSTPVLDTGAPVEGQLYEMPSAIEPQAQPVEEPREQEVPAPSLTVPIGGSVLPPGKRRRRGVRGGRRHRRGRGAVGSATPPARLGAEPAAAPQEHERVVVGSLPVEPSLGERRDRVAGWMAPREAPAREEEPLHEAAPFLRGRAGDPGLSSRMVLLESQLRRLLACAPGRLDQADRAPAGPGVFLLTDDDQLTNYYVEACQTLRIGIGNLLKERRLSPGKGAGAPLRTRLAKHLGITDAKATKYLAEHCIIRWLQLDDGAPYLANFAVALLRPILNEE